MGQWTKSPSEGGSGGKLGHSNMSHWTHTAEVKHNANLRRRNDDEDEATRQWMEFDLDPDLWER